MENYRPNSYTALHYLLNRNQPTNRAHPLVEEVDRHWLSLNLPDRIGDAMVWFAKDHLIRSLNERPVQAGRGLVLRKCYCGANPLAYDLHQRVLFQLLPDGSLMYTDMMITEKMALNGPHTGIYLTIELAGTGEDEIRTLG